jgi:NAD(P) transhydrogenase subunit alpha
MIRNALRAGTVVVLVALVLSAALPGVHGQQSPSADEPAQADSLAVDNFGDGTSSPSDAALSAVPAAQQRAPGDAEPREAAGKRPGKRDMLIASVTIFVLAIFVGFEVITKVPPTLHTPLMSGANAISGITIVGALIVAGHAGGFAAVLGFFAVVLAMINVVGGFGVTHRMLAMFKKR